MLLEDDELGALEDDGPGMLEDDELGALEDDEPGMLEDDELGMLEDPLGLDVSLDDMPEPLVVSLCFVVDFLCFAVCFFGVVVDCVSDVLVGSLVIDEPLLYCDESWCIELPVPAGVPVSELMPELDPEFGDAGAALRGIALEGAAPLLPEVVSELAWAKVAPIGTAKATAINAVINLLTFSLHKV